MPPANNVRNCVLFRVGLRPRCRTYRLAPLADQHNFTAVAVPITKPGRAGHFEELAAPKHAAAWWIGDDDILDPNEIGDRGESPCPHDSFAMPGLSAPQSKHAVRGSDRGDGESFDRIVLS